jgi:hypothetical protein
MLRTIRGNWISWIKSLKNAFFFDQAEAGFTKLNTWLVGCYEKSFSQSPNGGKADGKAVDSQAYHIQYSISEENLSRWAGISREELEAKTIEKYFDLVEAMLSDEK